MFMFRLQILQGKNSVNKCWFSAYYNGYLLTVGYYYATKKIVNITDSKNTARRLKVHEKNFVL